MNKYRTLPFIKGGLFFISALLLIAGGLSLVIGVVMVLTNQESAYGDLHLTAILGGLSLMVSGVAFLAFGAVIQVAVDIANNTAEMVEHGRQTSAFFSRVSTKINPQGEPRAVS
jgi:hypothetical protein